ncbi:hypothetical protein EAO76_22220 [Streptomyces sp. sk2.1]|nr:hypothetical protein EAO76_22220 [Streptomyces sp. sk2.1]
MFPVRDADRTGPGHAHPERHNRLKGDLACSVHRGERLVRQQIEMTTGDRIWHVFNTERRTVWIGSNP